MVVDHPAFFGRAADMPARNWTRVHAGGIVTGGCPECPIGSRERAVRTPATTGPTRHEGRSVQNRTESRLDHLRGTAPPRRHDARTIAALTRNPGCDRRAVLDAAGVDKERLARHIGFAPGFGQSRFAIVRGNTFEAQVKADGCAELLRLLEECLGIELPEAAYTDLGSGSAGSGSAGSGSAGSGSGGSDSGGAGSDGSDVGGSGSAGSGESLAARHARTVSVLRAAAGSGPDEGGPAVAALVGHPLLRLSVGGQNVHLEPDLVAVQHGGTFHIVEIKSFPVIDGQAEGEKVAAAAIQAAVYVLALRRMLGRPYAVSHDVVLICPKDFSNVPVATKVDVRRQLVVLEHQLARLTGVEALLAALPADLTFDLAPDATGTPTRSAADLITALGRLAARYAPDCLSVCELAFRCRHEALGRTAALGVSVREELGGVETVAEALDLAAGTRAPGGDQAEAAAMLRTTARMYAEALAESAAGSGDASVAAGPDGPGAPRGAAA